jgi:hypothetical protein
MTAVVTARYPVASYDGVSEWEAETLEDILKLFGSEEYLKVSSFEH